MGRLDSRASLYPRSANSQAGHVQRQSIVYKATELVPRRDVHAEMRKIQKLVVARPCVLPKLAPLLWSVHLGTDRTLEDVREDLEVSKRAGDSELVERVGIGSDSGYG